MEQNNRQEYSSLHSWGRNSSKLVILFMLVCFVSCVKPEKRYIGLLETNQGLPILSITAYGKGMENSSCDPSPATSSLAIKEKSVIFNKLSKIWQ